MTDDPVPEGDPLQEVYRCLSQLDAHYRQEDYTLEEPEETIQEAIQAVCDSIDRRRGEHKHE